MIAIPLSDDHWNRVSHLLSLDPAPRAGRPSRNPRDILNAILWIVTQNEKWHRLPGHFPPSQTCYAKWLQWRRSGVMEQILAALDLEICPKNGPETCLVRE